MATPIPKDAEKIASFDSKKSKYDVFFDGGVLYVADESGNVKSKIHKPEDQDDDSWRSTVSKIEKKYSEDKGESNVTDKVLQRVKSAGEAARRVTSAADKAEESKAAARQVTKAAQKTRDDKSAAKKEKPVSDKDVAAEMGRLVGEAKAEVEATSPNVEEALEGAKTGGGTAEDVVRAEGDYNAGEMRRAVSQATDEARAPAQAPQDAGVMLQPTNQANKNDPYTPRATTQAPAPTQGGISGMPGRMVADMIMGQAVPPMAEINAGAPSGSPSLDTAVKGQNFQPGVDLNRPLPSLPDLPQDRQQPQQQQQQQQQQQPAMQISGGGGIPMPKPPPTPTPEEVEARGQRYADATEKSIKGVLGVEEAKAKGAEKLADLYMQQAQKEAEVQAAVTGAQIKRQEHIEQYEKRSAYYQAEMAKLDPTIDPGRYWNNKSAGQVIFGLLAAACYGGLGKIDNWVAMINKRINQDINAQKETFKNRSSMIDRGLSESEKRFQLDMQFDNNLMSDIEIQRQIRLNDTIAKAKSIEASTTSDVAKATMGQIAAGLDLAREEALNKGRAEAAKEAQLKFSNELAVSQLKIAAKNAETQRLSLMAGQAAQDKAVIKTAAEIDTRVELIRLRLADARKVIENYGTAELTGPQQGYLASDLHIVATDAAKLRDPDSVARPSEVEGEKKAIGFEAGQKLIRNSTALQLIKHYEDQVEEIRREAFKARKLPYQPPNGSSFVENQD